MTAPADIRSVWASASPHSTVIYSSLETCSTYQERPQLAQQTLTIRAKRIETTTSMINSVTPDREKPFWLLEISMPKITNLQRWDEIKE